MSIIWQRAYLVALFSVLDATATMDTRNQDNYQAVSAEIVTVALRTAKVSGSLAAVTSIRRPQLASTYQVSPTIVREAVKKPGTEGSVATHEGQNISF